MSNLPKDYTPPSQVADYFERTEHSMLKTPGCQGYWDQLNPSADALNLVISQSKSRKRDLSFAKDDADRFCLEANEKIHTAMEDALQIERATSGLQIVTIVFPKGKLSSITRANRL
jgi:hypothetical protein